MLANYTSQALSFRLDCIARCLALVLPPILVTMHPFYSLKRIHLSKIVNSPEHLRHETLSRRRKPYETHPLSNSASLFLDNCHLHRPYLLHLLHLLHHLHLHLNHHHYHLVSSYNSSLLRIAIEK